MKLSIVTSLHRVEHFVANFCRRFTEEAQRLTPDWQIVVVNDGSGSVSLTPLAWT